MYSSLAASLLTALVEIKLPVRGVTPPVFPDVAPPPFRAMGMAPPPIVCSAIRLGASRTPYDASRLLLDRLVDMLSMWSAMRSNQSLYNGRQTVTPMQTSCVVMSAACHIKRSTMVTASQEKPGSVDTCPIHGEGGMLFQVGYTHGENLRHWRTQALIG